MRPGIAAPTLALLVALAGCDEDEPDLSGVTGVEWRLESLQRPDGAVLQVEPGRYTLRLDADGSAQARSDCNSCFGSYSLSGPSVTVGPLGCTRVFCGEVSLDQPYVRALQSARSLDARGDRLVVTGGQGTLHYRR